MIRKPMLAIGVAAVFAMAAGAAQAQTNTPMTPSTPVTPSPSQSMPVTPSPSPSLSQSQSQPGGSDEMKSSQAEPSNKADQKFVTEAIQGDMIEVKLGQLAQEKGGSRAMKQFGRTLVNDHSAHQKKAEQLAKSMGVTPPSELSAEQQAVYDKLSKLSGAEFDKEFAQAAVKDHREDIVEFLKESRQSGATANFAKETLPTLRKHLQLARRLTQQATTGRATTGRGSR